MTACRHRPGTSGTEGDRDRDGYSILILTIKRVGMLYNVHIIPGGPKKKVPNFAQVFSRRLSRYECDILQVY